MDKYNEPLPCVVCPTEPKVHTSNRFNISLVPVPICNVCADKITSQQLRWLQENQR